MSIFKIINFLNFLQLLPVVQQQTHSNGGTVTTKENSTVPSHSQPPQKEEQQQMVQISIFNLFYSFLFLGNGRSNCGGCVNGIPTTSSPFSAAFDNRQFKAECKWEFGVIFNNLIFSIKKSKF